MIGHGEAARHRHFHGGTKAHRTGDNRSLKTIYKSGESPTEQKDCRRQRRPKQVVATTIAAGMAPLPMIGVALRHPVRQVSPAATLQAYLKLRPLERGTSRVGGFEHAPCLLHSSALPHQPCTHGQFAVCNNPGYEAYCWHHWATPKILRV